MLHTTMTGEAEDSKYVGLVTEEPVRRHATPKWAAAFAVVGLVGTFFLVLSQDARRAAPPAVRLATVNVAADAADAVCSNTPFGTCMLNLTLFDKNVTSNCCMDGWNCVMFGPVYGMCMPGALSTPATLLALAEAPNGAPAAAAAEPDACPTTPFGQCGGLNFTQTKAEKDLFNYSATASPFVCCPAGFDCVAYGPVWAQCMPDWAAAFGAKGGGAGATDWASIFGSKKSSA